MGVRERLESYRELKIKLAGVQQELLVCRKRAKAEAKDQVYWKSRVRILALEVRSLKRQIKDLQEKIQLDLMNVPSLFDRRVITMHCLDGMTYKEISEATSFSLRTIYRAYHNAVNFLEETRKTGNSAQLKPPA